MHALIIGFGSIGKRHYENLRKIFTDPQITVLHLTPKKEGRTDNHCMREVFSAGEALDPKPDIAIISCPAPFHVKYALLMVEQGIHCLIEKPLSDSDDGIDSLKQTASLSGTIIMVGYNLRFLKSLQILKQEAEKGTIGKIRAVQAEVGQYLPDWRPGSDYKNGVSARKSLGGGAIFELSHEIDYVLWLLGRPDRVTATSGNVGNLGIDVEDYATMVLQFPDNKIASITLNFLDRCPVRRCRIIGEKGTLTWNGIQNRVDICNAGYSTWVNLYNEPDYDKNESYIQELLTFFACIDNKDKPETSIEHSEMVLKVALGAHLSAESGNRVIL